MVTVIRQEADTRFQDIFSAAAGSIDKSFALRKQKREQEEREDTFLAFMNEAPEMEDQDILFAAMKVVDDPTAGFQLGNQMIQNNIRRKEAEIRRQNELTKAATAKAKIDAETAKTQVPTKLELHATEGTATKNVFIPRTTIDKGPEAIDQFITEKHPKFSRVDPNIKEDALDTPSKIMASLSKKLAAGKKLSKDEGQQAEFLSALFKGDPVNQEMASALGLDISKFVESKEDVNRNVEDAEPKGAKDGTPPAGSGADDGVPQSLLTISDNRLAEMTKEEVQAMFDTMDIDSITSTEDQAKMLEIFKRYGLEVK